MNVGYLFLAVWFVLTATWIGALVDAGTTPDALFVRAGTRKSREMVMLAITGWIGGVYWFGLLRRRVKQNSATPPRSRAT